jgi:2',3'-cyclic-nucleotide 2'-phosphodiesterase (5'-nucleotidase family)
VLREALENGFSQIADGAGRFPQVSGIVVEVDPARPVGSRVLSVSVAGQPLDDAATYTVATNDFMANGGDGYGVFKGARQLITLIDAQLMASQVIDYVAAKGTVSPEVEGRIVLK